MTDTPGRISRSPSVQPSAPQSATRRSSGWSYDATSRLFEPSAISHSDRCATIRARGNARDPSASSSPPAWSKCRWLIATTSTVPGSKPAARIAGTTAEPSYSRIAVFFSSSRSPMPVSTRTRPAGVSISRQLSAWRRRRLSSSSPSAQGRHRMYGTGPMIAPASVRKVPAWISATVVPPPRSARQSTASFVPATSALGAAAIEVGVDCGRRGLALALVLRPELLRPVRALDRRAHPEEADLPDPHAAVQRDRQVGDVRELQRHGAAEPGVDVPRRGVDEQADASQRAPALEPRDEVVGQLNPLHGLAEDELAGVQDERLVVPDREQLGEVGL